MDQLLVLTAEELLGKYKYWNLYLYNVNIFKIAEIGINHNGDLEIAKKLIDVASDSNFQAVKFQKRNIEIVYTKEFLDEPRESPWGNTQRDQKKV